MTARIETLTGRRVWDSRGIPTVEAEIRLTDGSVGRSIAPAGASRGTHEAVDLRDGGDAFGGRGVDQAIRGLSEVIAPAMIGLPADDQKLIDKRLIELDGTPQKARLGGNATIATSMAVAHAAAAAAKVPLWFYLSTGNARQLPMPMVQLFGGGAHASRRIDVQDILIVPVKAQSFDEANEIVAEVYRAGGALMADRGLLRGVADEGGWWPEFSSNEEALEQTVRSIERARLRPGEDVAIAIDVAASQFACGEGRYRLATDGIELSSHELIGQLVGWCRHYPIISVEDPVGETDHAGMREFTRAVGEHVQVIGDDYLVTSAVRIAEAARTEACNAVLLKPNQVGTLTETYEALQTARQAGWHNVVSARSGETEDVTIVHLAVGWCADQLKVGSFSRSERMAKWNEAIRVEQALGSQAEFAGRAAIGGSRTLVFAQ
jgi:enolase